ncbi:MAG: hypothetical protein QNJ54_26455 [Prochloraceae cyanobacterium]|nr:hypothetical protein [Prochloraceae cyanobacterium]
MKSQAIKLLTGITLGLLIGGATSSVLAAPSPEKSIYQEISPYMDRLPQHLENRVIEQVKEGAIMGTFAVIIGVAVLAVKGERKKYNPKSSPNWAQNSHLKKVNRNIEKELVSLSSTGNSKNKTRY